MKTDKYDVLIIGGGASGLSAAISAKRTNKKASVAVVERLSKTGKKILATGNGRCNLSNAVLDPNKYIGSCANFLRSTADFSVAGFFESLGVICEDDGYGRIYPRCRSAASVLDALRLECAGLGVEEICDTAITDIDTADGFILHSAKGDIFARSVILAGGGKSQSALGSDGSVLGICSRLGIEIREPAPVLVPLKTDPSLVKPLKGQRADAVVEYWGYIPTAFGMRCAGSERGEVQFTDGLISGICVFDLSRFYEGFQYKKNAELRLDMLPDISENEVTKLLYETRKIRKNAPAEDFLSGIFTKPMGIYLLKRTYEKLPDRTKDITEPERLTKTIKSLSFPIKGTAGFERSQATSGGIIYYELTERYELKRFKGMYACGELLDICGCCGGYNLDFAFSSGAQAGKYAASDLYRRS